MTTIELTATPTSVKDLVESTGKSDSTVRKALKAMVEAGEAERTDDGYRTPVKTRANHGYARNGSAKRDADQRDADVTAFLETTEQARLKEIAESLSITVRAARHAIWRLGRNGRVEQVERGVYSLVDAA